jgi:MFS family permease
VLRNRKPGAPGAFTASRRYRHYVLGLLVLVGVMGWVDRNVFAVLLEAVKVELSLSDTQLGLLGGVAFGLFYASVGLPVAWLADKYNRNHLIAGALALWSLMTAACGLATGFLTLFLARVGVGVGEAGGTPPSLSLVSDYFAPQRRAFALGILYLYIPLGFVVGFLSGGWLNELFGWRLTFVIVGLPGVLLALVVRLTLREPPRGHSEALADAEPTPPLWSTLRYFWSRPSLRHLPLAGAIHGVGAFAAAVWLPAYFIRMYGVGTAEAGAWLALAYGCGGAIGVLCGGYVADLTVRRTGDERWYAWGSALVIVATLPCTLVLYTTGRPMIAVSSLLVTTTFSHMFLGPVTAVIQGLAGLRRRAVAAALYLFLVNLLSMGAGPVAVGIASDLLGTRLGNESLRAALLVIVSATSIWAAIHLLLAAKELRADLAYARGATVTDAVARARRAVAPAHVPAHDPHLPT